MVQRVPPQGAREGGRLVTGRKAKSSAKARPVKLKARKTPPHGGRSSRGDNLHPLSHQGCEVIPTRVSSSNAAIAAATTDTLLCWSLISPWLGQGDKLRLGMTSTRFRDLVNGSWTELSFTYGVAAVTSSRRGRKTFLSEVPLFEYATRVLGHPRMSSLVYLDLKGMIIGSKSNAYPELLVTVLRNCKKLTTLKLWDSYCSGWANGKCPRSPSSKVMAGAYTEECIAEHGRQLEHLAYPESEYAHKGLAQILSSCKSLVSLHIKCRTVSDKGLRTFGQYKPERLKTLTLLGASKVTAAGLKMVAEACPGLQRLTWCDCERIKHKDSGLPHVKELLQYSTTRTEDDILLFDEDDLLKPYFKPSLVSKHE
ncbi:unnamed protein product [Chrysoparadoxa australica]